MARRILQYGNRCVVIWEIFHWVLGLPGVARKARNVLLFALIMIFIKAGGGAWSGSVLWPGTAMEFELNLRTMSLMVLAFTTTLEALARIEHDRLSRNGLVQARAFLGKAMRP